MSDELPTLWHFTCEHGRRGVGNRGKLKPNRHPLMPELGPIVWLTADPSPERDAIGLTSDHLSCDRMAYRYRVVASDAHPWSAYRHLVVPAVAADLESFADPSSWWVATYAEVVAG